MDSNTHSTQPPARPPDAHSDELAALAAALDRLAAQDLDGLPDTVVAEQALALRRLVDRLECQWLPGMESRPARPPGGCGVGFASGLVLPAGRSGRPGPCSVGPWSGRRRR